MPAYMSVIDKYHLNCMSLNHAVGIGDRSAF